MDTLYEQDFFVWTKTQAEALRAAARAGSNQPLDFENLAEEIESLGRSERREIGSLTDLIVEHLLKLACSPAQEPRGKWTGGIRRLRQRLARVLDDNPSLRREMQAFVENSFRPALGEAEASFREHHEISALEALEAWRSRGMTAAEVLSNGLYPEPGTTRFVRDAD